MRVSGQTLRPRATPVLVLPRFERYSRLYLPYSVRCDGAAKHRGGECDPVCLLGADSGGHGLRHRTDQLEVCRHRIDRNTHYLAGVALLSPAAAKPVARSEATRKLGPVCGAGSV